MAIEVEGPSSLAEKDEAIAKARSAIEKAHGKGALVRLGDRVGQTIPSIPTGIYDVDYKVLGCGGLPKGRIIECVGLESGGKSSLALLAIASAQRLGGRAAFIDAEHALDPTWAARIGVDVDNLIISQPDYAEQAFSIVETLLESHAFDIIVIDSVAALVPKSEVDGDYGDAGMGVQARLMGQAMRKLNGVVYKANCVLLFINQIREKLGVMWGSNETTPGGRALKFYSSVRLDVRRIGSVKEGETIIGNRVRIKAIKNKVDAPFREAEVDLLFESGFDPVGNLLDVAVDRGVCQKAGSWFSYGADRLGQGRLNAISAIKDGELEAKILAEVRKKDA